MPTRPVVRSPSGTDTVFRGRGRVPDIGCASRVVVGVWLVFLVAENEERQPVIWLASLISGDLVFLARSAWWAAAWLVDCLRFVYARHLFLNLQTPCIPLMGHFWGAWRKACTKNGKAVKANRLNR